MRNNAAIESVFMGSGKKNKKSNKNTKSWFKKFIDFFKPVESENKIQDPNLISKTYKFWRTAIFISIYGMYFISYLSRKNLSAAMPAMSLDLNISNTKLGVLGAVFYATYGLGKFINGILADRTNVRALLPITVTLSGLASAGMAFSTFILNTDQLFGIPTTTLLVWVMSFFWGLNGFFSSAGFPLCGKTLIFWFSNKERPSKWAWWSTSHEFGSTAALLLAAPIITAYGWKAAFYVPAVISVIASIIAVFTLRDKPSSIGLPDIEEYHNTEKPKEVKETSCEEGANESYFKTFKEHILFNKNMWFLAGAMVFVYILRFGPMDWLIKLFLKNGNESLMMASIKACFIPFFGSIGTLTIPYVSRKVFKDRRAPANFCYLMLAVVSLLGIQFLHGVDASGHAINYGIIGKILELVFLALLGIATCGPLVLIGGLCSVESTCKKVAAASTGFTGIAGYVGAIFSAYGTGRIIDAFGESAAINFWIVSAVLAALLCLPLWNKKSVL